MNSDEEQIRAVVTNWMVASKQGNVDAVLEMMTDDAIFLRAGHTPMGKKEFERTARANADGGPQFDGHSELQEIQIAGEWAFAWNQLRVEITLPDGTRKTMSGPTLTIFRKSGGKWLLARDANMLAPVQS